MINKIETGAKYYRSIELVLTLITVGFGGHYFVYFERNDKPHYIQKMILSRAQFIHDDGGCYAIKIRQDTYSYLLLDIHLFLYVPYSSTPPPTKHIQF